MVNGERSKKKAKTHEGARFADAVERGDANVFVDLKVPRPAEALARAELARQIANMLDRRGLTQAQAARVLGVDQPKISALLRGRLQGFSSDRLFRFLNALGADVDIVVHNQDRKNRAARTRVLLAP